MNSKILVIILAVLLALSLGYNFLGGTSSAPSETSTSSGEGEKQLWTCGMHPNVVLDHPGICPICEMNLVPLKTDKNQKSGEISIDPVVSQNIGVRTASVARQNIGRTIRTNGKVMVDESRTYMITPKLSGWIEKLYVDKTGQEVKRGTPLFEIYSPELVAAQEEYLLALSSVKTAGLSGVASLENSSQKMLDAARDRLLNWDLSTMQISKLEESGKASRLTTYYSPGDGIVMHKNAVEGDRVNAGADLMQLANLKEIWIEAEVYEYELPWIDVGSSVKVLSPYDPTVTVTAQINYIYPYLNPQNRAAKIRLQVENSSLTFKPGMFVDLQLDARMIENAIVLPREAVVRSGKYSLVFLAKDEGKFEPRTVKLGLEGDDGMFEILSGVEEGETVVTSAQFLIDSERQLKEALAKLLAGGGSEEDLHKSMGHDHASMSKGEKKGVMEMSEASGVTMEDVFTSDSLYACPNHDHVITAESNTICPLDKTPLVTMTADDITTLRDSDPYACVMCPIVHPGTEKDERCAICNMKLKPIPRETN